MDNVSKYPQLLKQILACRIAEVIEKSLRSPGPEMLVQVEANSGHVSGSSATYWIASVISIKSFDLTLKFIGETNNETVLNMKLYSPRLRPVGWSKETAVTFRPPKHLVEKVGSSACSAVLDQRLQQPFVTLPSYLRAINSTLVSSKRDFKNSV